MARRLGDTITIDFTTHDPITGQVVNAAAVACQVFEADTDIPVLAPVPVGRGLVGNYRVTFDATVANGFEAGKCYNVIAQATVGGITAKARIASFTLEALAPAVFRV
jgi:hypothetical protein